MICAKCERVQTWLDKFDSKESESKSIGPSCVISERQFVFGRYAVLCTDCINALQDHITERDVELRRLVALYAKDAVGVEKYDMEMRVIFDAWLKADVAGETGLGESRP